MAHQNPLHLIFLLAITLSVALVVISGAVSATTTGDDGQSKGDMDNSVGDGAWQVVQHPEQDPHVQGIIQFALAQQNALATSKQLIFQKTIRVERRYVTGIITKVVMAAGDGYGVTKTCEAVVWVKPWINYMKLTSFKIIG